jgi:hypothetical protein
METYPLSVVDNFFDNPDKIREYALSLEYARDPDGHWPGLRSRQISEIHSVFYRRMLEKVFSLYMEDLDFKEWSCSASMKFQLIPAGENYEGWIHLDNDAILTAIVYLTPSGDFNTGTSLFKLKDNHIGYDASWNKHKQLTNKTRDEQEQYRLKNNDQFIETSRVGGFYNRFIAFDSGEFHAANDISMNNKEDRLTLIIFFHRIEGMNQDPVSRVKRVKI